MAGAGGVCLSPAPAPLATVLMGLMRILTAICASIEQSPSSSSLSWPLFLYVSHKLSAVCQRMDHPCSHDSQTPYTSPEHPNPPSQETETQFQNLKLFYWFPKLCRSEFAELERVA